MWSIVIENHSMTDWWLDQMIRRFYVEKTYGLSRDLLRVTRVE